MKVNQLSMQANEFIQQCDRRTTITDKEIVKEWLKQNGIPVFQALLDFQEKYGGINYSFGGKLNHSCTLDVMRHPATGCGMPKVFKYKDQYMVECLHFIYEGVHKSGYMDRAGKLYYLNSENPYPFVNNIQELLEKHAMYYRLLQKQKQWVVRELYESDVTAWLSNTEQKPIPLLEASQEDSTWWQSHDGKLFVSIHRVTGSRFAAKAYAADAAVLQQHGLSSNLSLQGFPFSCYYDPEKETVEMENTKEIYCFNQRLYRTCNYSRVTIQQVKEIKEVPLYLSGQKDIHVKNHVEEFLLKLPNLVLPTDDYDPSLIEFARQSGDEMILKLISYLADMKHPDDRNRRTPAEHNLDRLLYQEYLRRMSLVVEGQPVKVNPLFFYPYHIARAPEVFDIENDYFVIKRMRHSYVRSISKLAFFYMKCAQQGNEAASQAYRVYEPLLLLYCLGGYILKEHGFIEVGGGAFHQHSWQLLIGKEPIDIYRRATEAWEQRNWEHAIAQIQRIKWAEKNVAQSRVSDETWNVAFARIERKLGIDPSEFAFRSVDEQQLVSKLFAACPELRRVQGTLAHWICDSYLQWAVLLDRKHPVAMKYPCLYEPFIELLRDEIQTEAWEEQTMLLIALLEQESILNYADALRGNDH
ncbi:hypothetical protein M3650_04105 [Paenibacillus sp. MER TA 81-3]|uniref:hypothetical protein n=1 Tax=Paenibacillus sp. MER TA 81-3 TaxID=2939573 RepID=UPI00203CDF33|nr:hypothetical protein [Paenibacillus sp. MER TA 81-3]MCM3337837.1 hypothetical protein [Paenibacillus sp. MER TA 81-3]